MNTDAILNRASDFPYDAPDRWQEGRDMRKAPRAQDWAHLAARGILTYLTEQNAIGDYFACLPEAARKDMTESISQIIRAAERRDRALSKLARTDSELGLV